MNLPRNFLFLVAVLIAITTLHAAEFDLAANATNQLAVDLHRQLATGNENLCVSPYSIESAMAAFDQPPGSADFDRMAPRKPNNYLYISQVFHKTFMPWMKREPKQPPPQPWR